MTRWNRQSQRPKTFTQEVDGRLLTAIDFLDGRYVFVHETDENTMDYWFSSYLHVFDLISGKHSTFQICNRGPQVIGTDRYIIVNPEVVILGVKSSNNLTLKFCTLDYKLREPIVLPEFNQNSSLQMNFDRNQSKLFLYEDDAVIVLKVDSRNFGVEKICRFDVSHQQQIYDLHWYNNKVWYFTTINQTNKNTLGCFDVKKEMIRDVDLAMQKEMKIESWTTYTSIWRKWKNEFCYTNFHSKQQANYAFSILDLRTMQTRIWMLKTEIPIEFRIWMYSENAENQLICKHRKFYNGEQFKSDYAFYRIPTRTPDRLSLLAFVKARPQLDIETAEMFANRIPTSLL